MRKFSLAISFLCCCYFTYGQVKVHINDNVGIISTEVKNQISIHFKQNGMDISSELNYDNRCEFYFVNFFIRDDEAFIHILDCNSRSIGGKNLGKHIIEGNSQEIATLISFASIDIIKKDLPNDKFQWDPADGIIHRYSPEVIPDSQRSISNEHNSRYFFAPSAYNLKKGELYYNSIYFLLHDIQYGIGDKFSFGMGTTIAAIPFYFTPKISFPIGRKSAFGIGNIMVLGTWGVDFFGNLLYGVYTYGSDDALSIGAGLFSSTDNDFTAKTNSPILNVSGVLRISDYVYAVSENYALNMNFNQFAEYDEMGSPQYLKEDFTHMQNVILGITGLRFVNKKKNVICWQIGLTYIFNFPESLPDKYLLSGWSASVNDGGMNFFAIPILNYTHKFGKKF